MRIGWLIGATALLACAATSIPDANPARPSEPDPVVNSVHHVLFVGNSLTYFNDLPATFAAIAASNGDSMMIASATGPNLALIDHLTGGSNAADLLNQQRWDYVILQQGPTSSGICRDSLVLWTHMFDVRVRAAGGRSALFMTWPESAGTNRWDDVRASFLLAAQSVDGAFLPAGEAWRLALAAHAGLPLYGHDGYHPSEMGSFLAALEIYERLSGRDVTTLPARAFSYGAPMTMGSDTIRWLQQAAHDANVAYPAFDKRVVNQPPTDYRPANSTTC